MTNFSLIHCTCDDYDDLWDNFFILLKKYWPEFKGDVLFNSDTKEYKNKDFNIINVKHSKDCKASWSQRLYDSLKLVKTDFILLFLDDFYLESRVNHKEFLSCLSFMEQHKNINGIAFTLEPGIKKKLEGDLSEFCYRKHLAPYKVTAHIALYRTAFLKKILKRNESAWEFEVNGTIRSFLKKGAFICKNNRNFTFPYSYGLLIRQGKFDRDLKMHFEYNEGLKFNKNRLFVEKDSAKKRKIRKLKYIISGLLSFFSRKPL